jgi:hypothetical protein
MRLWSTIVTFPASADLSPESKGDFTRRIGKHYIAVDNELSTRIIHK